jgi:hypothetical protein
MNRLLTAFAIGTAVVSGATAAHATIATISFSATYPTHSTDFANTQSIGLFDTNLGTLFAIQFSTSYGFNSTLTVTSQSDGATGSAKTESAAGFTDASSSAIQAVLVSLLGEHSVQIGTPSLALAAYDENGSSINYTLNNGQSSGGTSTASGSANSTSDFNSADFGAFSARGGGTTGITLTTLTGTDISITQGNATASQVTTSGGTLSVTYTYDNSTATPPTGVPEPASMALLGAGLLGAGLVRRRNK